VRSLRGIKRISCQCQMPVLPKCLRSSFRRWKGRGLCRGGFISTGRRPTPGKQARADQARGTKGWSVVTISKLGDGRDLSVSLP
jgi:hypothetical protein